MSPDPPLPEPDQPAFLDWFKSPDPPDPEAEPGPEPEPELPVLNQLPVLNELPVTGLPSAEATKPIPKFTPITWSAVVTADRTYYDQMQAERARTGWDLPFPAYSAERRFPLAGQQMRIGRRSAARAVEPEIDLSGPPVDPGISRLHALLLPAPDGSWAVLDPGSANGTLLNGREMTPGELMLLRDGDRINLGAWTAITVRRE
jgi:hypothetical protein